MLHELIARTKERHLAVMQAEAALDVARRVLEEDQEYLLKKAQRLHSWLTVMAETDELLRSKLVGVALPKLKRVRNDATPSEGEEALAPKKRGRPRKELPESEALFSQPSPS